ncbi:DUF4426 domain-containing protein [Marinomonas ostreistagni]|uniref:DUF4426 domain-containing protein n=1 Tax=Marinomonas ostreistagni TaxID=359209 RepID=A0ABS0ZBV9_9GAMM|nr:DUF4426 domain-containing protein [Marinomonas ostreistagni]MBJ7551107.1 DUF4426 domain-containing protein [Marinomonas ostreistagni]
MKWLLGVVSALMMSAVQADQVTQFGDYQLHYNTFESTFLTPEIAHQYGLTRTKGQALLNVAVTTQTEGELPQSQRALVSANVKNLLGQIVSLSFITIEEGDAVYYLAPFTKTDDEILTFTVNAKLSADSAPMTVNFQRHFYVD